MRALLTVLLLLPLAACLWQGPEVDTRGLDTRFTIIHTSDIHSRLFPFHLAPNAGDQSLGLDEGNAPFGGAARLAYLIKRERGRSARSLHIDSGDCYQGAPIFNMRRGEPEMRFLSDMGANAVVIGNHEFDSGVENLAEKLHAFARYDNLAANYLFPDSGDPNRHTLGDVTEPYAFYNVDGIKVTVIGMANLGSLTSIGEGGNSLKITPLEQNETVRSYVQFLDGVTDLFIVVSHLGLGEDEELIAGYEKVVWKDRIHPNWEILEELDNERALVWIPGVRGLDLILGGHLHVALNPPKLLTDVDGRTVVLSHSGAFAKFLGRLDLVLRDELDDDGNYRGKEIVAHKYQVFPVDERLAFLEDEQTADMLEPYLLEMQRELDLERIIGYAPQAIKRFSVHGNGDSALGNLVAESMRSRRRVDAEFAVTNTLGIRDNLYAGPITLEDMFNVFPFENSVTVMSLSGTEVQELVDFMTFRSASRGCNAQAQVAGIAFTMNCGQVLENEKNPDAFVSPGEDISINGEPLKKNTTYRVATNDYIANGGSGFRVLKRNTTKQNTGIALRDALIDYMRMLPTCAEYEARVARYCDQPDEFSQSICREVAGAGRIPLQPAAQGPFAEYPCVVGIEDGRIGRKVRVGLDTLPDPRDQEVQP